MPQSSNAVHRYQVAAPRARIAERVVDGDTRAHERPRFLRRQLIGNCGQRCRRGHHILGVPAVEIEACDFAVDAHRKIAAPALLAHETMSAMPAHANALTFLPFNDVVADRIDASADFMPRHTRILKPGPQTLFDEHIAVANAACLDFHANLPSARLRDVAFHQFPICTGFADLRRLHFRIHKMPPFLICAVLAFAFSS